MTPLSYHSSNLLLITLETMRLLVHINRYLAFKTISNIFGDIESPTNPFDKWHLICASAAYITHI